MQKFILNLILFIFILFSILLGVLALNRHFANFKIQENSKILIIGHSHSECAYNDSLINGVTNCSQSGESYFYSYIKTKLLVEQNPNINTVFIEFSNNQINTPVDDWIWKDNFMSHGFSKYGAFMDYNSLKLLLNKNPKCFASSSNTLMSHSIKKTFKDFKYQDDIGGYLYLERDKTDSLLANRPIDSHIKNQPQALSKYNLEYLQKTIDYLISKHKKVYLIRSPLHKMYEGYANEQQFQELYKNKFSKIELLDFSQFPLLNSEFGDLEHLNHKGATKFSIWFNTLLSNGLLKKTNKQEFINNEIKHECTTKAL